MKGGKPRFFLNEKFCFGGSVVLCNLFQAFICFYPPYYSRVHFL